MSNAAARDDAARSCFECNLCYRGGLRCPKCGASSGEPLPQGPAPQAIDLVRDLVDDEAVLWDNLEGAVIGCAYRCGQSPVVLYDREKCIGLLVEGGCSDRDEAEEYFEFNIAGAWVGDLTPMIAVLV